jgi:hypothetical protein
VKRFSSSSGFAAGVGRGRQVSAWDDRVDVWESVAASPAFQQLAERVRDLAQPVREDRSSTWAPVLGC